MKAKVKNLKTGAIWSTEDHKSSVWKKETLGRNHSHDTLPVGTVVDNFWPLRGWNKSKFRLLCMYSN